MFFTPKHMDILSEKKYAVTESTCLFLPETRVKAFLTETINKSLRREKRAGEEECRSVSFFDRIPEELVPSLEEPGESPERYAVEVGEDIKVYAECESGFVFALSTLMDINSSEGLTEAFIYDYPLAGIRGYRVYMPGRENIGIFKDMIDLLARYKFNSIILEVGGAMEYKRHPEINTSWVEFCNDMRRYSGRYAEVQRKYSYKKNSVHVENGDGSYLSQDECRDIADYCRARGLEIIPECPTLSHADYLLLPHPEYCERENDEIPDTYCPNHPDIYPYVFDVLDEVIKVFNPKKINIGHDEFYSMCICERCKGLDPVDVYIKDIETLAAYLDGKGIETLMWGEKLLKAVGPKGQHYGGWYDDKIYPDGTHFKVPDFYYCASRMPKNVTYLQWYWIFGKHLDRVYHDNGYKMVFGNFSAIECDSFRERIAWGAMGGFVSNWGSNEDEYMQRNCQYYNLLSTAYALWCHDFDDTKRMWLDKKVMEENYRRHYSGKQNLITVTHTTSHYEKYMEFWCGIFIEDEKYLLGHYKAVYDDGSYALFPVKYGTNITNMYAGGESDSELADRCGSSAYKEISGSALPVMKNGKLFFETKYENPHSEKKIASFEYVPAPGKEHIEVITLDVLI